MNKPIRTIAIKGHEISTYRLNSGRYMVVWYDTGGERQRRSRGTLKEAEELVDEVSQAIQDRVKGEMTVDDCQVYNLAREIAERNGYTVLKAMNEWEKSKAPYRGKKVRDVIEELITAKRREQLSTFYVDRLEDDLEGFAKSVPQEIEQVTAAHIKGFLNGCEVGPRRLNNLRDQIVTLFRYARTQRYLPRDRTTEAEDVAKMKVPRKTVQVYEPEELAILIENTRRRLAALDFVQRVRRHSHLRGAAHGLVKRTLDSKAD